jgi:hemoglobin
MYEQIGGQAVIDKLVNDFYDIMSSDQSASAVFSTHAGLEMSVTREKLRTFLSGWLGGPQLYLEKFGHPRLRMKHFPFKISQTEAMQWLYCMKLALEKSSIEPVIQAKLMDAFENVALMLKNQQD